MLVIMLAGVPYLGGPHAYFEKTDCIKRFMSYPIDFIDFSPIFSFHDCLIRIIAAIAVVTVEKAKKSPRAHSGGLIYWKAGYFLAPYVKTLRRFPFGIVGGTQGFLNLLLDCLRHGHNLIVHIVPATAFATYFRTILSGQQFQFLDHLTQLA